MFRLWSSSFNLQRLIKDKSVTFYASINLQIQFLLSCYQTIRQRWQRGVLGRWSKQLLILLIFLSFLYFTHSFYINIFFYTSVIMLIPSLTMYQIRTFQFFQQKVIITYVCTDKCLFYGINNIKISISHAVFFRYWFFICSKLNIFFFK